MAEEATVTDDMKILREFIANGDDVCGFRRAKALDALERLEKWQRLRAEDIITLGQELGATQVERDSLRAKLAKAREALKPFAEASGNLDDDFRDKSDIWEHSSAMSITGGDLRRARSILAELSDDAPAQGEFGMS